jgi:hypothetical protein
VRGSKREVKDLTAQNSPSRLSIDKKRRIRRKEEDALNGCQKVTRASRRELEGFLALLVYIYV